MGRTNGKDGRGLTQEDVRVWKVGTHDVVPLEEGAKHEIPGDDFVSPPQKSAVPKPPAAIPPPKAPERKEPSQPPQLDLRTDLRLRRGQMEIQARLDLHGLSQEQAHNRLNDFVVSSHRRGFRCVLVITGKGKSGQGVLRDKLPHWLSMSPISGLVLKTQVATVRDGGSGAFYLYLKRTRTPKN